MAEVNVTKVVVNNPISDIFDPFVFTIEFEALNKLQADIEWKIFYISTVNEEDGEGNRDIELDNILLGPIERGVMMFDYAVNPPDYKNMDIDNVLGLQAILISAHYKEKEFIRIAYYMNSYYKDVELREKPPLVPQYDKICRHIFVESPRIVKFNINWDNDEKDEFKEFDKENQNIEIAGSEIEDVDVSQETEHPSKIPPEVSQNVTTPAPAPANTNGNTNDNNGNLYSGKFSEVNISSGNNKYNNYNSNNNNLLNQNYAANNNSGVQNDFENYDIYNANLNGISRIRIDNN